MGILVGVIVSFVWRLRSGSIFEEGCVRCRSLIRNSLSWTRDREWFWWGFVFGKGNCRRLGSSWFLGFVVLQERFHDGGIFFVFLSNRF